VVGEVIIMKICKHISLNVFDIIVIGLKKNILC